MAVVRESIVAEAHASYGSVHVLVADELTPAEAKDLRKLIKKAEKEATEHNEAVDSVEGQVHDIFSGILGGVVRVNLGGPAGGVDQGVGKPDLA